MLTARAGIVTFLFFISSLAIAQQWEEQAPFPGPSRDDGIGFSINGVGYVGTGISTGGIFNNDFYAYYPGSNTWAAIPNIIGTARQYCASFSLNGKGYVVGGILDGWTYTNEMQSYDPASNLWSIVEPLPANARFSSSSVSIGHKGYLFGGRNQTVSFNDVWEYNALTKTWTQKNNLPNGSRYEAIVFNIAGIAYFGLGKDVNGTCYSDLWQYAPLSDTWEQKASFPGSICTYSMSFVHGQYAYVCTGIDAGNNQVDEFWSYDSQNDEWVQLDYPPFGKIRGVSAFTIDDCSYITTGKDEFNVRSVRTWKYCASFNAELLLKVYPNPAHDLLTIDIVNDHISGEFQLYDLQGKMVLQQNFDHGTNTHQLNLVGLQKGLYLLRLLDESGKEIQQSKFLKL